MSQVILDIKLDPEGENCNVLKVLGQCEGRRHCIYHNPRDIRLGDREYLSLTWDIESSVPLFLSSANEGGRGGVGDVETNLQLQRHQCLLLFQP